VNLDHYDTLGVEKNSSAEEIKKAYRGKAKNAHPDSGGSDADMALINGAYAVLCDPARKRDYDNGGDGDFNTIEAEAEKNYFEIFTCAINCVTDPIHENIVIAMEEMRLDAEVEGGKSSAKINERIRDFEQIALRISGDERLQENIESRILDCQDNLREIEKSLEMLTLVKAMISKCDYKSEAKARKSSFMDSVLDVRGALTQEIMHSLDHTQTGDPL